MSFHRFNGFTGRLRQCTQLQAFYPLSPIPLQKVEAPRMIFDSIKTKVAGASAPKQSYSTISPKFVKLQQQFQADLTTPSYLLRGTSDKILYGISIALIVVNSVINIYYITELRKKFK